MHQGCSVILSNRAYQDDSVILKFNFNLIENLFVCMTAPFMTPEFILLWSLKNFHLQLSYQVVTKVEVFEVGQYEVHVFKCVLYIGTWYYSIIEA
jgi:hypothetical protein